MGGIARLAITLYNAGVRFANDKIGLAAGAGLMSAMNEPVSGMKPSLVGQLKSGWWQYRVCHNEYSRTPCTALIVKRGIKANQHIVGPSSTIKAHGGRFRL